VKNNELDPNLTLFVAAVAQWIMPLFFVLSGMNSFASLESRRAGAYIGNRFRRLAVPLLFGVFVVLAPVQVWIERASHGQFDGSFLEFYPHYFEGLYGFGGNFAWMGLHLWYLEMLFLFTLVTLPPFLFLRKEGTRRRIARAAGFSRRRGRYSSSRRHSFFRKGWSISSLPVRASGLSAAGAPAPTWSSSGWAFLRPSTPAAGWRWKEPGRFRLRSAS
jgi:fucose 4-O-acetylase-like acetyltransferase